MNRIVVKTPDVLRTWSPLTRHSSLDEGCLQQSNMEGRKALDSAVQAGGFVTCLHDGAVAPADRKTLNFIRQTAASRLVAELEGHLRWPKTQGRPTP
jgi:hypothetical protein